MSKNPNLGFVQGIWSFLGFSPTLFILSYLSLQISSMIKTLFNITSIIWQIRIKLPQNLNLEFSYYNQKPKILIWQPRDQIRVLATPQTHVIQLGQSLYAISIMFKCPIFHMHASVTLEPRVQIYKHLSLLMIYHEEAGIINNEKIKHKHKGTQ